MIWNSHHENAAFFYFFHANKNKTKEETRLDDDWCRQYSANLLRARTKPTPLRLPLWPPMIWSTVTGGTRSWPRSNSTPSWSRRPSLPLSRNNCPLPLFSARSKKKRYRSSTRSVTSWVASSRRMTWHCSHWSRPPEWAQWGEEFLQTTPNGEFLSLKQTYALNKDFSDPQLLVILKSSSQMPIWCGKQQLREKNSSCQNQIGMSKENFFHLHNELTTTLMDTRLDGIGEMNGKGWPRKLSTSDQLGLFLNWMRRPGTFSDMATKFHISVSQAHTYVNCTLNCIKE